MSLHAIVDSPELYIGHDMQNQWLYADWKGEYDQEASRAACALLLTSLRVWPCQKILNDNSGVTRTTAQLTDWGVRWLDELRAAGLQYIAWVLPRNPLARRCNEEKVHAIDYPRVGTFDDVASAYAWLQQQTVVSEQLAVCN
ncbi:hypothetical protein [Hymenobacter sp.]|uniref:hypothetical protein n=1 Tax=Hymenobacter sp. TaxID=1898978 RepID=UPI00286BEE74|nr:hypothetical protein [Hymenobacter sp.]